MGVLEAGRVCGRGDGQKRENEPDQPQVAPSTGESGYCPAADSLEDSSPSSFRRKCMTRRSESPSEFITVRRNGVNMQVPSAFYISHKQRSVGHPKKRRTA